MSRTRLSLALLASLALALWAVPPVAATPVAYPVIQPSISKMKGMGAGCGGTALGVWIPNVGHFFWNALSTATADGVNVIQCTGVTTGRMIIDPGPLALASIAAMQNLPGPVNSMKITIPGTQGGDFVFNSSSSCSTDNSTCYLALDGTVGRWIRVTGNILQFDWYGAPIYGSGDATTDFASAIAKATTNIASGVNGPPLYVDTAFSFTSVQIPAGLRFFGQFTPLYPDAGATTDTAVSLNGDFNILNGLRLIGQYSTAYYTSMIHWYTYNTATWYPGYNHLDGLYTEGCDICMDVGGPPSQYNKSAGVSGIWGLSSTATTAPNAENAPLSESSIVNWTSYGAIRPFYMFQTNGKLTIANSKIIANANQWTSPTYANVAAITLLASSSLNIDTSSIESNPSTCTGRLLDLEDASQLFAVNNIIESCNPIWLSDQAALQISDAADFGFNTTAPVFQVASTWTGTASIRNSVLFRPSTVNTGYFPIAASYASFGGAVSPNLAGRINFSGVTFQNLGSNFSSSYAGSLCEEVRCYFTNSWVDVLSTTDTYRYRLSDGPDLLRGIVDETAFTLPTYPSISTTPISGWTAALSGAGKWGQQTTGLPTIPDLPAGNALEINASGTTTSDTASVVSAPIYVPTDKLDILRFFGNFGGSGSVYIYVYYYDFGGSAMAHTRDALFSGSMSSFSSGWMPYTYLLPPPCAATPSYPCIPTGTSKIAIEFYVDTSASIQILYATLK